MSRKTEEIALCKAEKKRKKRSYGCQKCLCHYYYLYSPNSQYCDKSICSYHPPKLLPKYFPTERKKSNKRKTLNVFVSKIYLFHFIVNVLKHPLTPFQYF